MRIAFDHQIFVQQSYGGISRYFASLADEFVANDCELGIFAPLHRNQYLDGLPPGVVHGHRVNRYPPKTARLFLAYNYFCTKHKLRSWKPQIVHETYYARHTVAPKHCPVVVTAHDMIHELFSGEFSGRDKTTLLKRLAIERADHVICVSESTRRDLIRLFGVPEAKLSVVHLGCKPFASAHISDIGSNSNEGKPYLLYVGSRVGYKNFSGLLRALAASPRLKNDFDVLTFGGGGFSANEQAFIRELGYDSSQVRQIGGDDAVLGRLYTNARAFVYPSLYEGFGLPPLEAMAHSCPVISSNTSSMPEVIGSAGEFFGPTDTDDMAAAIERVVYDDVRTADLVSKGSERLNHFSWQRCAEETLSIYRALQE